MPRKQIWNTEFTEPECRIYPNYIEKKAVAVQVDSAASKHFTFLPILLFAVLTLLVLPLWGVELGKEMKALETMFWEGDLEELPAKLIKSKPKGDEEMALQSYINAMLQTSQKDTQQLLRQTMDRYPSTHYGQMSMLETAKLLVFERKYVEAETLLNRINNQDISERYYWLAYCSQAQDKYEEAAVRGREYLRRQPKGKHAEDTYYLIATMKQQQRKYAEGIQALEELRAIPGFPRSKQYFHHLLGRLHHQSGNWSKAYENYKEGFLLNKGSQLAYELEDLLFELKEARGSSIDLSFMYPYTKLDLPELQEIPAPPELPAIDLGKEALRAQNKPKGSNYVQAGRFGSEDNAKSRASAMRALNLNAYYYEDSANRSIPWVVFCGPYSSASEAETVRQILTRNSIDCFITNY